MFFAIRRNVDFVLKIAKLGQLYLYVKLVICISEEYGKKIFFMFVIIGNHDSACFCRYGCN